ncbi:putative cytochrome P450 [Lyophyllum shimeji]|uniref:Cytochrome P450 n=1 Tax=Lyophyllum shimeji TaxID=47721 RepID=A0A9P3PYE8_LYOSH|nr:putative cytochrome P450 [Lyophyllum shimeji]
MMSRGLHNRKLAANPETSSLRTLIYHKSIILSVTDMPWTIVLSSSVFFVCWSLYRLIRRASTRTTLDNVPGLPHTSWLRGNLPKMYDSNAFRTHQEIEETYGSVMKFYGILGERRLYVSDRKALYHVFVKDQDAFVQPEEYYMAYVFKPVASDQRREHRKLLTPAFNINRMRQLTPGMYEVAKKLKRPFDGELANGPEEIDVLGWITPIALQLIRHAGLSFDTPTDGDASEAFATAIIETLPISGWTRIRRQILSWAMGQAGERFRRFALNYRPWRTLQLLFRPAHKVSDPLDPTISALSATIHMLAKNPSAQDQLRNEINGASGNRDDEIPYDVLVDLPFLDAVCRETLRLFPPFVTIPRVTATDAVLPLSRPIVGVDGKELHEIVIPAHTPIYSSVLSANRDPAIWGADTYQWKPQRWIDGLPQAVKEAAIPAIYSHLMTFVGGGHSCIGVEVLQFEMKAMLSMLVNNFHFALSDKDEDISWETTGVTSPVLVSIDGTKTHQLPLVVTAIDVN